MSHDTEIKEKTLLEAMPTAQDNLPAIHENPSGTLKQSDSLPSEEPQEPKIHTDDDKDRLTLALAKVCALQKQYGKTAAELDTLVEGYCWVLDYPMDVILNALRLYVRKKADIPTPADLEAIINPPKQPLSAAVYVAIKKRIRDDTYVTPEEREYCWSFERQEMDKMRGGTEELKAAQRELLAYQGAWDDEKQAA